MALAPYNVLDAAGATIALNKLPSTPGVRVDMVGVGLSDEDRTLLDTLETLIAATNAKLDTLEISVDAVTTAITGNIAHDAVDSGNGSKVSAKAESSPKGLTLVADADRTDLFADLDGLQMVKLNTSNADLVSERVSNADGAATAFANFGAVANTRNYVTSYSVFRTDAGATMAYVDFRDGVGGPVLWSVPLPAGGGAIQTSAVPLFKTTANTALAYDVSGALSTVYISVAGFQSKA